MQRQEGTPQEMRERLQKAQAAGYHVLSITEMMFSGDMSSLIEADSLSEHPSQILTLTCLIEHADHWHVYVYTLVKPDFDTKSHILTDRLMERLEMMAMDERATVGAVGRA